MHRRGILRGMAVTLGGVLGGCTGLEPPTADATAPTADRIVDREVALGPGDRKAAEDSPMLRFDPSSDSVIIEGDLVVGPSSCTGFWVDTVEYSEGDLYVTIESRSVDDSKTGETQACTADVVVKNYELVVSFDEGLPETVVATEHDGRGETRRTRRER